METSNSYSITETKKDDPSKSSVRLVDNNSIFANGFVQVPTMILRSSRISPFAKLLFSVLLSYAWQENLCFPSMETLVNDLGVKRQAISRYLRELEKAGLIRTERRKTVPSSNIYFIETRLSEIERHQASTGFNQDAASMDLSTASG